MNKLKILSFTFACNLVSLVAAAQEGSTLGVVTTKVRADPAHPVRIGENNYPKESKRLHEESVCKVKLTVTAEGLIRDVSLTQSTGYPRLDQARLQAFAHGGLLPATQNGTPLTTTLEIPITWKLAGPAPKIDCSSIN
jgi:TonB family protein